MNPPLFTLLLYFGPLRWWQLFGGYRFFFWRLVFMFLDTFAECIIESRLLVVCDLINDSILVVKLRTIMAA